MLGSDALYREWGYVAMSRGRETNQLYVHTTDDMQPDAHLRPDPVDPVTATVTRLSRSRAQQPVAPTLGQQLRDIDRYLVSPAARRARPLHDEHRRLTDQLQHLHQRHEHLEQQADRHGLALSRRARADRRRLETDLGDVTRRLTEVGDHLTQINRALIGLPTRDDLDDALDQHRELSRDLDRAARRLTRQSLQRPPAHLTDTLGPLPHDAHGHDSWRDAAHAIHHYRIAWDITDPTHALGHTPPTDPDQRDDLGRVLTAIEQHRTRTVDRHLHRSRGLGRSR